jgi:hypothetical protein
MKRASLYALVLSALIVASGFVVALPQRRVEFRYTYDSAVELIHREVALDCRGKCSSYRLWHCHRTTGGRARCGLSAWLRQRTRPCRTGLSAWRRARPAEDGPFSIPAERWIEFDVDNEESRCVMQIFPFGVPPSPPPLAG